MEKTKKVLFTATVDSHIIQFHLPFLKLFKDNGYEVHVATNGNENIPYCDVKHLVSFERSPLKIRNIKAIRQLKKICNDERFDVIHTHTPMGSVVTRIAAKKTRKLFGTRVIYTAHGFHFFKGASLKNWLIFYPVEKWLSRYTDTLITINLEDYELASKKFSKRCRDIQYVPGVGIDEDKFNFSFTKKQKIDLRKSLGILENDFVMIYPAELSKRKRQIWLINTISSFLKENNDVHLLLPGKDSLCGECQKLVNRLKLNDKIHFLGYRNDVPQLLKISNLALSSSNQEGLPVNLMEALYVGLPIVATNCRGNRDLIKNGNNSYLIDLNDSTGFINSVREVYDRKNDSTIKMGKELINDFLLNSILIKMNFIYRFIPINIKNNNLISVIVPIHNSEEYLDKCLKSIIEQSYDNLEIILIHDNCSDNSLEISKYYKERDKRIKIYEVNYSNVSKVRNYGIDKSNGNYILFIDSDDYIECSMIEKLLSQSFLYNSDISCCSFSFEDENGAIYKHVKSNSKILNRNEFPKEINDNKAMQGYVWNKLYNKQLIKNKGVKFDEKIKIMEDDLFNYTIFNNNQNYTVSFLNEKLYHYVKHNTSASKEKYNLKKFDIFESRIKEINILEKNKYDSSYLMCEYIFVFSRDYYLMKKNDFLNSNQYKYYLDYYMKYKKKIKFNNLCFIQKIKLFISIYFPCLFLFWIYKNKKL